MSYRTYQLIATVLLRLASVSIIAIGVERMAGTHQTIWWLVITWGIVVAVASLVFVGVTVSRTSEVTCPDSGEKVVARVGLGLNSGHLYLTRK
jgi:hypothetical protein